MRAPPSSFFFSAAVGLAVHGVGSIALWRVMVVTNHLIIKALYSIERKRMAGSSSGKLAEIHIPLAEAQDTRISSVHAMPFNTDYNGNVPTKAFFNSTSSIPSSSSSVSEKSNEEMTSYIRGRELKGLTFPIPQGMVGTIVRKDTETGQLAFLCIPFKYFSSYLMYSTLLCRSYLQRCVQGDSCVGT